MKNAIVLATVIGSASLLSVGCNPKPAYTNRVQPSALPPAAKAMLAPEAEITSVHQAVYAKGGKDYVIDYKIDGIPKQAIYGDYHQTQPTYVFEKFDVPQTKK